ncbi:MAG: c-type cytochrome, partial [Alphaproteobacteria bacterium]|nr:c-type cytochrome [Alphaproteobacteria bacterium]
MRLILLIAVLAAFAVGNGAVIAQNESKPTADSNVRKVKPFIEIWSTTFTEIKEFPDLSNYRGDAERGAYVLRLAGCATCHTAPKGGKFLAGGRELKSPFGSFFPPNITPDTETGIGSWSVQDFVRAVQFGKSPRGRPYYPAFPYTSYSRMALQDIVDLKAYLDTVEPVRNPVPDHKLGFPFSIRAGMSIWRALFFDTEVPSSRTGPSDAW